MYRYSLEINTRPIPKQRPRLSKFAVYTPKKTADYEKLIAYEWKRRYKNLILKGAVKFVNCGFNIKFKNDTNLFIDIMESCEDIEVIGNIYENKELLENDR